MSTFFYMLLAFIVGVLVGWFLWGRLRGELDSLRGDLDRTKSERDRLRADTNRLSGELDACSRARADLEGRLREAPSTPAKTGANKAAAPAPAAVMSTPAAAKSSPAKSAAAKPAAAKPAAKSATPRASTAPKKTPTPKKAAAPKAPAGKADNLRRLIGIGPVNEKLLKGQGVTTYAQIAAWTEADVKRIEDVLNFDGRIAREKWIEQAKLLASGNEAEFARQFPTAGTSSNT
ncbi:proton-conducting membrane transporter [Mesorhizobium sp.]|uniref:proton-conducting membrane transporter n=1 Tax=Mesorhizobium sp. TaxID=1871066 RepID=UPI000FEA65E3|nr:proton-conducting membrane transporter [Mesorhizobium sp.]RWM30704.1 MAG: proton-conducting membrane transporter [Mesorhizobium sp.]RWM41990.1 MAG: proton-conducting membrane transporter [Mesorhizobium sp.]TJV53941.1 MAG: proton-conducting membrane transporter [Mesorhizobium sp.]